MWLVPTHRQSCIYKQLFTFVTCFAFVYLMCIVMLVCECRQQFMFVCLIFLFCTKYILNEFNYFKLAFHRTYYFVKLVILISIYFNRFGLTLINLSLIFFKLSVLICICFKQIRPTLCHHFVISKHLHTLDMTLILWYVQPHK